MGKKLDKKAKAAVAKAAKGIKAEKAVKKFRKLESKLWTREYLLKIAEFDGATIAPANGAAARADAMGTLAGEHHKLLTSEKSVELVRSLARETVVGGKIDDPQLLDEIRVLGRDQREASAIPTEEAEAWTRLTCEADAVWHKAKSANGWASFEPYVDKIVGQLKHQAELMDPQRDPYDVWLDQYERGLSTESFDAFCNEVKATVVPLVHAIGERGQQPTADFLHAHVPEAAQRAMSFDLMKLVGLNLDDTTLAFTEHPFSEGFSVGDARIATHIYEDDCISNVYSIIHEAGHAMYELGVNPAYARTCLEGGTSMGIHESQSRFFENTVGRSRAFMGPLLEVLRRHAPEVYGNVDEDALYHAVNIAQPSLIRTEADELTYPLTLWCATRSSACCLPARPRPRISPRSGTALWTSTWAFRFPTTRAAACRIRTGAAARLATSPPMRWAAPTMPCSCRPCAATASTLPAPARAATWHPSAPGWASTFGSGAAPRTRRNSSRAPAAWTLTPATTAATCRTSSPHCTSCKD